MSEGCLVEFVRYLGFANGYCLKSHRWDKSNLSPTVQDWDKLLTHLLLCFFLVWSFQLSFPYIKSSVFFLQNYCLIFVFGTSKKKNKYRIKANIFFVTIVNQGAYLFISLFLFVTGYIQCIVTDKHLYHKKQVVKKRKLFFFSLNDFQVAKRQRVKSCMSKAWNTGFGEDTQISVLLPEKQVQKQQRMASSVTSPAFCCGKQGIFLYF